MNKVVHAALGVLAAGWWLAATSTTGAQAPNHPMHPRPGAPPAAEPTPPPTLPARANPAAATSAYANIPAKKNAAGEQFFIVASLDLQKSQLLLKYPTEVTLLVKAGPQTKFLDDAGKPMKLADLRSGDTVWVTSTGSGDNTTALNVRKGQMTVADLHRYYLDYEPIK